MEFHSIGGGRTGLQGPKKKIQKKSRREKLSGSRSQVPPQRAALELCTKLGCQTQTGENGEGYVSYLQGFVGGDTRRNIVQNTECRVSVTKMEVSRDVVGGLCSKAKKRELVLGDV